MNLINYRPVYVGTFFLLLTAVLAVVNGTVPFPGNVLHIFAWGFIYGIGLICGWYFRHRKYFVFRFIAYAIFGVACFRGVARWQAGNWELGLVEVLTLIQAAQNFTLSRRRDLYFAYVISLVLVLYAASCSKETGFLFFIVAYVLSGMFTLMADHLDERLASARSGDLEILTARMRLPVKGIGIGMLTVGLAFLLYLIVPRPPSPNVSIFPSSGGPWYAGAPVESKTEQASGGGRQGRKDKGGTRSAKGRDAKGKAEPASGKLTGGSALQYAGFSKDFDITKKTKVKLSENKVLFYSQAEEPFYARAKIFDTYENGIWSTVGGRRITIRSPKGSFIRPRRPGELPTNHNAQFYMIVGELPGFILAHYLSESLFFPTSSLLYDYPESVEQVAGNIVPGTRYSVVSYFEKLEGRSCAGEKSTIELSRYVRLPENSEKIKELANSLTSALTNDFEKATAIEWYLRKNFQYSPDAPEDNGADLIERFLFSGTEGDDDVFATAMVLLLRSAGVPARLATGYHVTRYNPIIAYYEVRLFDAHAWVEAHIDGHGWVTFEPTPAFNLPQNSRNYFAITSFFHYLKDRVGEKMKAHTGTWWSNLLRALRTVLRKIETFLRFCMDTIWKTLKQVWLGLSLQSVMFLLLAAIAMGCMFVFSHFVAPSLQVFYLRRLIDRDARQFSFSCYRAMEKIFSRKGATRPECYTPAEYLAELQARFPSLSLETGIITRVFQRARYSLQSPTHQDLERAYKAYRAILRVAVFGFSATSRTPGL
jgi:protein-glutamine gamma-glutamyltransferase